MGLKRKINQHFTNQRVTKSKMAQKKYNKKMIDLERYQLAYQNNLSKNKQIMILIIYVAVGASILWLLFGYLAVTLIGALMGLWYAKKIVLPYEIRTLYEENALLMRNKMINSLTQMLTNPQKTTLDALVELESRLEGELQKELQSVLAQVSDAGSLEIQTIFNQWSAHYAKDIIFGQYLEQIATAIIEGRTNTETLKDIKTYHNDLKRRQNSYMKAKKNHAKEVYTVLGMVFGLVALISFGIGRDQFITVYAHRPIGWGVNIVFLIIEGFFYLQFYKFYRDNDIVVV